MKKFLIFALLLALLTVSALAEGEAFNLRNGVTWGMSRAQVLEAEGDPAADSDREAGFDTLEIEDIDVYGARGELEYWFLEDRLVAAVYDFDFARAEATPAAAEEALRQKYGEPAGTDAARWKALEDILDGESEPRPTDAFLSWELPDGTYIALAVEADDREARIGFYDEARLLAAR